MSLSAGLVGVIPAIEKLLDSSEEGPIRLGTGTLILWSLGLAFFGVIFSVPLRKQVIIKEKLRFPSGTATATMITILHNTEAKKRTNDQLSESGLLTEDGEERPERPETMTGASATYDWRSQTVILSVAFGVSAIYVRISSTKNFKMII